jgi:hypothetical protein
VREVEWTDTALEHMAVLDKGIARRVKEAVERFAGTGAGNVKRLQGIDPPEYPASAWETTGSASTRRARRFAFSRSATAARRTAEESAGIRVAIEVAVRHAFSPQLELLGAARARRLERPILHQRIQARGLSRGE